MPYFQRLFASGMRESASNEIKIEDADADSFNHVLKFIYCAQLPDDLKETAGDILPIAEKYDIQVGWIIYMTCIHASEMHGHNEK